MTHNNQMHLTLHACCTAAAAILTVLLVLILPCESVLADKVVDSNRSGSVTIRYFDDVDAKTPVNGAQFTFYKIDDSQDTTTYTDTTNQDGILRITDMKLGRYRVVETAPAPGHKASASFLLTIPMTENNEWIYDLTLEPKASLELQTTTKSVYTGTGNTSTGQSTTTNRSTSVGTSTQSTSQSGTTAGSRSAAMNRGTESGQTERTVQAAATGDTTHPVYWIILCLSSLFFIVRISVTKTAHLSLQNKPKSK